MKSAAFVLFLFLFFNPSSVFGQAATTGTLLPTTPQSSICQMFPYTRYIPVNTITDLKKKMRRAEPGDMIELLPGFYYSDESTEDQQFPGFRQAADGEDEAFSGYGPGNGGTIYLKNGQKGNMITLCGSQEGTIIDGTQSDGSAAGCAIRVVSSSYVRVAGFTLQGAKKGIDIQNTTYSEFKYIYTRDTLQEGIRVRYDSKYNDIEYNKITNTGRMWAGYGEGIYIGTSKRNSVLYGYPPDKTDYNNFRHNVFGPGVLAENIDVKEFTTGGKLVNNSFDGREIKGINGASSWVSLKGNKWSVFDNKGVAIGAKKGAGFRVVFQWEGQAQGNKLFDNTCYNLNTNSFCVYVSPGALATSVACTNTVATTISTRAASTGKQITKPSPPPPPVGPQLCNCNRRCIRRRSASTSRADSIRAGLVTEAWAVNGIDDSFEEIRPLGD